MFIWIAVFRLFPWSRLCLAAFSTYILWWFRWQMQATHEYKSWSTLNSCLLWVLRHTLIADSRVSCLRSNLLQLACLKWHQISKQRCRKAARSVIVNCHFLQYSKKSMKKGNGFLYRWLRSTTYTITIIIKYICKAISLVMLLDIVHNVT